MSCGPDRNLRILVCAFGPFPGVPVNPSQRAVRDLLRIRRPAVSNMDLHVEILPTRWDALARLDTLMEQLAPDGVLLFGVASRRRRVCVEAQAVNAARDFPDAARRHPPARRLSRGGPDRRAATTSVTPLLKAVRDFGVAAAASRDAGRYLCNASYFHALGHARRADAPPPVIFVHLPGRAGRPRGVGRERMARALSALLAAFLAAARQARRSGRDQTS